MADLDAQSGNAPPLRVGDIQGLDHGVIRVPDLEQGLAWYKLFLGLVEVDRRNGRAYLASPGRTVPVLALTEGGLGLEYVGFRVDGKDALERLGATLDHHGIAAKFGLGDSCSGLDAALRLTLPTGHTMELLARSEEESHEAVPGLTPGAMQVHSSHLQFRTPDVTGMSQFLQKLGFKVSAFAREPGSDKDFISFLRVTAFHHQVAVLAGPKGLHHYALEVETTDFWKLLDHMGANRIKAEYGPGRHHTGNSLFLYVRDPFGNRIEIGGPMLMVGFDYPPHSETDAPDPGHLMNMWGPQPPPSWFSEWT